MDRKTLGEMIPPRHQSQAQDGFDASMIAQDKAKRIADIEARHAADDARRIRVLRAWGPLYHLTGNPQTAIEKTTHWRAWAARIIDVVAALKAEDLLDRLDEINTGERDTLSSRAAKLAVEVYRLAIDANAETVAKAVADIMCEKGPTSKSQPSREHFAEMLRWRILIGVFAAEWRRFTLADLERELERLAEGGARTTAADPTPGTKSAVPAARRRRPEPC
jgi:hypothetical protein